MENLYLENILKFLILAFILNAAINNNSKKALENIIPDKTKLIEEINSLGENKKGYCEEKQVYTKNLNLKKNNKIYLLTEDTLYELLNKFYNTIIDKKIEKIIEAVKNNKEDNFTLIDKKIDKILLKGDTPNKDQCNLFDILNENYIGVTITVSFVDSSTLTGEVLKTIGDCLVLKANQLIYYINKDNIISFN